MSKKPNPTPAPKSAPAPATIPEDDGIVITAKTRAGGGAIDQIRRHLVSHPTASIADLRAMLLAANLDVSEGTIKTTRAQTLSVLKFLRAQQAGEKITSIEGPADAVKFYVVQHPQASVEAISAWLASKGAMHPGRCQKQPIGHAGDSQSGSLNHNPATAGPTVETPLAF